MTHRYPLSPGELTGEFRDRLGLVIEWLLVALLIFMPAALGVVAPWSETITLAAVLLIALLLVCRWLFGGAAVGPRPAIGLLIPVLLFAVLVAAQLLPLPAAWIGAISPKTLATHQRLLADLPNAAAIWKSLTLSFYPPATRHDLRIVLIAITVFVTIIEVYRRPAQIRRLLGAIALIGGAVAVLALLQDLSKTELIYWVIPSQYRAVCGPFVNYSNFSQFMNLSIGAALGLLLLKYDDFRQANRLLLGAPDRTMGDLVEAASSPAFRIVGLLAAMIVLSGAALFLSMSRGGMLSMLAATVFTVLMLAWRRGASAQAWLVSVLALLVFGTLLYGGFDAVCDRLTTLYNRADPSSGRFQTYKDIAHIWTKFPAVGTGLGTHQYIYPMFDRSTDPKIGEYADSDWFQLAEETGAAGLLLVVAFVAMIWFHFVRATRHARHGIQLAAFGLGFGFLAVLLNSFTDFGQHLPAVAVLSAITCGLLVNLSRIGRRRNDQAHDSPEVISEPSRPARARTSPWRTLGWTLPAGGLVAALAWALVGSATVLGASVHWDRAGVIATRLQEQNWHGSDEDYIALLTDAQAAARAVPDDVRYQYALNCYRWYAVSRPVDGAAADAGLLPEQLEQVRRIVAELQLARRLCPTFGAACSLAGQLEFFTLNEPRGADRVREGYRLYPNHPDVCFSAGLVDTSQQKWDESLAHFRRCLTLAPAMFPEIVAAYVGQANRPDLAVELARGNVDRLLAVSRALETLDNKQPATLAAQKAFAQAAKELNAQGAPDDASNWTLYEMSRLCQQQQDLPAATKYFKRAVEKNYGEPSWHLELAYLLSKQGRTMEAVHEARICLHLRPGEDAAKQLIGNLSLRPDFVAQE